MSQKSNYLSDFELLSLTYAELHAMLDQVCAEMKPLDDPKMLEFRTLHTQETRIRIALQKKPYTYPYSSDPFKEKPTIHELIKLNYIALSRLSEATLHTMLGQISEELTPLEESFNKNPKEQRNFDDREISIYHALSIQRKAIEQLLASKSFNPGKKMMA